MKKPGIISVIKYIQRALNSPNRPWLIWWMTRGDLTDLNGLNTDRYGQFFWNPCPLSSVSVRHCPFFEINCGICFANVTSKNLYSCRKFQAQKRYEFLSQTVEEAKIKIKAVCRRVSVAQYKSYTILTPGLSSAALAKEEASSSTFAQGCGGQASKASGIWWRCPGFIALRRGKEEKAAPFEWSCASHGEEKTYVFVRHFFPKKWRLEFLSSPAILNGILSLKLQYFAVKWNSENRFTLIQKNSEYYSIPVR